MSHMTLGGYSRRNSKPGLGSLGGKKSRRILFYQMQAAAADEAAKKEALTKLPALDAAMGKINNSVNAARDQAYSVSSLASSVDHPSAISLGQEAQDAASEIETLAGEARQAYNECDSMVRAKKGSGAEMLVAVEQASGAIAMVQRRIVQAGNTLNATVARLQSLKKTADAAASTAADAAAERVRLAEEARLREQAHLDAEAERIRLAEEARIAREQAARDMEYQLQQDQLAEQRRLAEQERAYEQAERDRLAQIEQARIDAQMRREQMAIDAENRRMQQQQEAALREEERLIRREEREAQLQQLMLIQELAAAGLPVQNLPAGLAPPQPQAQVQPTGSQYYMPGFSQPVQAQPQAWTPWGPEVPGPGGVAPTGFAPTVPGVALMPYQAAPAGYAATAPQTYQQSAGFSPTYPQQAPQGPGDAPPGFAWAGFDPGTEMFGMGDMGGFIPTINPNLQGALVEDGWDVSGPYEDDMYVITRPNGQLLGRYTEDQLFMGGIRDPQSHLLVKGLGANAIVFVPPATRPKSDRTAAAVTGEIAATVRELIKGATSVMTEQERRKAAKYGANQPYAMSIPGAGYSADPAPSRIPSVVWIGAGLAVAGAAFWGISRMGKKGKKEE